MFRFLTSLLNLKTTPPTKEPLSQGPRLEDMRGGKGKRRRATESEFTSYYGRPVVKKAHWVWPIWFYFWVGGIAGGASAVAALAELFGDKEDSSIVRTGHYISLAGLIASPVLLIIDLQRPERFHHMLRILKLRSPLSLGTYILTSAGFLSGLNAAGQIVEDGLIVSKDSWPGKLVLALSSRETRALQGIDGLALGGYTGTLLSATAVPLWADMNELISPLFVSSALSTGSAAIALARALNGTPTHELHRLDPIEQIAITSELSLIGASLPTPQTANPPLFVRELVRRAKSGRRRSWNDRATPVTTTLTQKRPARAPTQHSKFADGTERWPVPPHRPGRSRQSILRQPGRLPRYN